MKYKADIRCVCDVGEYCPECCGAVGLCAGHYCDAYCEMPFSRDMEPVIIERAKERAPDGWREIWARYSFRAAPAPPPPPMDGGTVLKSSSLAGMLEELGMDPDEYDDALALG